MNRKESSTVPALLAVLLFVALLGGCGSGTNEAVPSASGALTGATTVGINVCTGCHIQTAADWLTSKHANAAGGLNSAGTPTVGQVTGGTGCAACHDPNGDSANIIAAGNIGNVARPVVGCEACHGGGSLHYGSGPISLLSGTFVATSVGTVQVSGQFVMCTNCHELLDSSGTATVPSPVHGLASVVTPIGTQYTITDTHFASPGTYDASGHNLGTAPIGYSMDFASQKVCTDCHNPHKNAETNREWAASGHANRSPGPWTAYNWTCVDGPCVFFGVPGLGSRTQCQRCHTTTGFASYVDALRNGNAALAEGIAAGSSPAIAYNAQFKPQMLECTGCHTDNRGTVRNPGAVTITYKLPVNDWPATIVTAAKATYTYPDIGASNVCIPCHSGRGSGRTIHNLNTGQGPEQNFGALFGGPIAGFLGSYLYADPHYLTAAGTMFRGTGYEFYGRSYADPLSFRHQQIGTASVANTGTDGPCVGCHMYRHGQPANHLFEAVVKENGIVTNVSSEVCFNCHAGSSVDFAEIVKLEKERYEDALQALSQSLLASSPSFSFGASLPYFNYSNWLSTGDTDWTGNTTGKNNIGAALNMALLSHEEGGYVHNSRYVKRLIYDSIDWLDDHAMNYSVGTTINGQCGASPGAFPWCDEAKKYLLNGAAGTSGERP